MTEPYLPDPRIEIGADGTPRSGVSDDVYYSAAGGAAETRHVFLGGIGAPRIWQDRSRFRIAELGFGTGLNFLVTVSDWLETAPADTTLDYIAVEGYPPDRETLARALAGADEVRSLTDVLIDAWPARVGGFHRLTFMDGRVRLTLAFGEVLDMLGAMRAPVDAWFLDGFAPVKNPDMWSPEVLGHVARLSVPGCRLATFTVAGAVRRGLADLGFVVEKRPGFGRKRDALAARMPGDAAPAGHSPKSRVAVIGAGIAGAAVARALTQREIDVRVFAAGDDAPASANPAALIAPRLPRERTVLGRVMAAGYLQAIRCYDGLAADGADVWLGPRGTLTLARDDDEAERQSRALKAFGFPAEDMRPVTAAEAVMIAGSSLDRPGLWFARAGTLRPEAVTAALLRNIPVEVRRIDDLTALRRDADVVILAAGTGVLDLLGEDALPMRANRGQLSYLSADPVAPEVPVTFGGYVTPRVPLGDGQDGHVLGATYARRGEVPAADWQSLRDDDHAQMTENLARHIPNMAAAMPIGGRTALRATVRDYLPIVGPLGDDLWVLTGLGSRGFTTAPLMAEVLADRLCGLPPPLEAELIDAVGPGRFS